ncbi:hypothetical protein M4I32_06010 [Microbacterium sp. LRZ72]|nr:hypothetical protein [Microbacterium sp. LRZ72]MDX2376352.1 hypothetical protein [Microbacterium sp. LRZ72]
MTLVRAYRAVGLRARTTLRSPVDNQKTRDRAKVDEDDVGDVDVT